MTYFKQCPECDNRCYSASWRGSWECPYCGRKLDDVEAKSIAELEKDDNSNNFGPEFQDGDDSYQTESEVNIEE